MNKYVKFALYVIAAIIAVNIAIELLSMVTSFWFIVTAVAVWWFFFRDGSKMKS